MCRFVGPDFDTEAAQKVAYKIASSVSCNDKWICNNILLYLMIQESDDLLDVQQKILRDQFKWDVLPLRIYQKQTNPRAGDIS